MCPKYLISVCKCSLLPSLSHTHRNAVHFCESHLCKVASQEVAHIKSNVESQRHQFHKFEVSRREVEKREKGGGGGGGGC